MDNAQKIRQKWFLKSRTLWGALIAFVPTVFATLGLGDIQDLPFINDSGLQVIDALNELVGLGLVAWARYSDGGTQAARLTFT